MQGYGPSENKMDAIRMVQIHHMHARFPRSKKWPTRHIAVPTGNARASFSEKIA